MKFSLAQLCFFVVFFGTIPLAQSSSGVATVSGRVLTEDGHPVSDASVYLASLNGVAVGRPATVTTDKAGVFKISVKEPGTYVIHALKPEEGYADVIFAFDLAPGRVLKQQRINISKGQNLTGVDVTLGPKSAVLHFKVVDERTGQEIATADYRLCQVQVPENCVNSRAVGEFETTVPATEISVQISSPGYSKTTYTEKNRPFVIVKPGEERTLVVRLPPSNENEDE